MNYDQYLAEDFAADDYFKEWVCEPTPETQAFWQAFLAGYPERYYQVEEARRLVIGLNGIDRAAAVPEWQVNRLWSRIEESIATLEAPYRQQLWRRDYVLQLAAAVVLLLGTGWGYYVWQEQEKASDSPVAEQSTSPVWEEAVNEANKTMTIQLSDGSTVRLEKNSHLRYPKDFEGTERQVYLTGDAFFEIQKNPNRPFLVYANGLITKVLGTSFYIHAHQEAPDVTVSVRSGRVSVYADVPNPKADPEAGGVVLTPNQKAIFQRKDASISKSLVEKPILLMERAPAQLFAFESASARQVFDALEKAYGVEVLFDEELMKECQLTLNLTHENLYQKLEVICKVLGAEYKLIDGQIIIYSRGC
ncbi:FecR family protein [Arundinibacter roseus]|uniref:FecR family protein n=1 Tax=Arundinibacter roseus TaxID=2070510 RepID=A0A4R4K6X3_9BACT|nr:FecR family protein [Arundinibacter roseus]TDB62336.1 FecR family protein [Arundinibacter roseus]